MGRMLRALNSNTANLNGWVRSLAKSCVSLSTEAGRACSSGSRANPRPHERTWNRLNSVARKKIGPNHYLSVARTLKNQTRGGASVKTPWEDFDVTRRQITRTR